MKNEALQKEILKLKNKKKAIILAHNYQIPEIQDIADFLGDSLELSKLSITLDAPMIVFCGVKFMAETAKILSPQKRVILPTLDARCPLADTIKPQELIELKNKYPDAWVVSYVNTSAEIKALTDTCCTSANAVKIVKNVPAKKIIFIPDKNLGWWVKKNITDKEIITSQGFCYVHEQFRLSDLEEAKEKFPDAEIIVHPECRKEILEKADLVLSTAGMLKHAKESKSHRFIIGTEEGLIYRLQKDNPDKKFYSLGSAKMCINMKKTTLKELYQSLKEEIYEINIDTHIMDKARKSLENMVKFL